MSSVGVWGSVVALVLTFWIIHARPASAHPLDITFTTIVFEDARVRVETRMTTRQVALDFLGTPDNFEVGSFHPVQERIREMVRQSLTFTADGSPCPLAESALTYPEAGPLTALLLDGFQFRGTYVCPGRPQRLVVENRLFISGFPDQRNVIVVGTRGSAEEHVFTPKRTTAQILLPSSTLTFLGDTTHPRRWAALQLPKVSSALRFLRLGVEHIAIGYDHIAFIIGIHLVVRRFREIVKIVTSFTIAHSITLTLSFFDILKIPNQIAEIAIAATILFIGIENLFRKDFRSRSLITFGLGLVHGLGLASVLKGIGIPREFILLDLVSFNLGVEVGQLTVIALLVPMVFFVAKRSPRLNREIVYWGSVALSTLGGAWTIQRIGNVLGLL